jgi:hypothetical protein
MRRKAEIAFSLFVAVVVAWFVWQAIGSGPLYAGPPMPRGWGPKSALFPLVIGIPTLVLALVQVAIDVGGRRAAKVRSADAEPELPPDVLRHRTMVILLTIVGFVVATWLLGFTIAVPLVTLLYLKVGAGEPWRISLILTVVAGISFYLLFVLGLSIPMPEGLLVTLVLDSLGV